MTKPQLNERQLQVHVPVVGWLFIVANAVILVIAAFVLVLLVGIGVSVGEPEAMTILSIVGTGVALLLAVLSVPGIVAGVGLLARKSWARILTIVLSILGLVNFPIGTLIGVYALWVLMQEGATGYFS
ncbi:MAG: hypothetical protein IT330_13675 [Anaerolineae bacterium]|nr:hypothetical protein [Anaerolineae bacterium]